VQGGAATAVGLGDVTVEASAELVTAADWRAGVSLGAGLPTGDDDDGLGMGHAMLMPGLWASAQPGPWRLAGSLSLGFSVESDDAGGHDHHHGHTVPVVNPMNRREVGGEADAGVVGRPFIARGVLDLTRHF
jgi:hypothetical protein